MCYRVRNTWAISARKKKNTVLLTVSTWQQAIKPPLHDITHANLHVMRTREACNLDNNPLACLTLSAPLGRQMQGCSAAWRAHCSIGQAQNPRTKLLACLVTRAKHGATHSCAYPSNAAPPSRQLQNARVPPRSTQLHAPKDPRAPQQQTPSYPGRHSSSRSCLTAGQASRMPGFAALLEWFVLVYSRCSRRASNSSASILSASSKERTLTYRLLIRTRTNCRS